MDFYETSACTNLNIKEVRTLGLLLCVWWDGEKQQQTEPRCNGRPLLPGPLQGHWKQRWICWPNLCSLASQSFTRLTELVLQAHRKELDGLRTCASNELALAELEEDEGKPEGPANSSKTCWC